MCFGNFFQNDSINKMIKIIHLNMIIDGLGSLMLAFKNKNMLEQKNAMYNIYQGDIFNIFFLFFFLLTFWI